MILMVRLVQADRRKSDLRALIAPTVPPSVPPLTAPAPAPTQEAGWGEVDVEGAVGGGRWYGYLELARGYLFKGKISSNASEVMSPT